MEIGFTTMPAWDSDSRFPGPVIHRVDDLIWLPTRQAILVDNAAWLLGLTVL
jgi:hypothetical protein